MLLSLHVKNLALIDEEEVEFGSGLNILTGETGAGKSIIIGSVNLALGARGDNDLIRNGAEYALIELTFQVSDAKLLEKIRQMDVPIEEDGILLIQRKIMPNRSIFKISGETVTAKTIRDISSVLIDIHGQHEHQSLFHIGKHLEFLDEYAKSELTELKKELVLKFQHYQTAKKELHELTLNESSREKEIKLLEFEQNEIKTAKLKEGEDEELEKSYRKMLHARKITETAGIIYQMMGNENGAGEMIGRAARELKGVLEFDENLNGLEETLSSLEILTDEFNRSIQDYMMDLEFEEKEFLTVQERLDLLNHLKMKYKLSLSGILEQQKKTEDKLELLYHYDEILKEKKEICSSLESDLNKICVQITSVRRKFAMELADILVTSLEELNFLQVQFEIQVRDQQTIGSDGWDEVEFMISTNPGEPLRPLSLVASGGELSRIMLALKTVIAGKDSIETLIFDEIDSGISGKTAWKVSEKLSILGNTHQIICITHLPQIAAMADRHFIIQKDAAEGVTKTQIRQIDETGCITELARMLGGEYITEAVINNAKDLKVLAAKTKLARNS